MEGELKASKLEAKHKRALFNSIRAYDSVSLVVHIPKVYDCILKDKKSICRYKDYVLKRCVKEKLKQMIHQGRLSASDDVTIHISIDEQLTATNGYYDLRDSIQEELQYGVCNFDYGITHPNVFTGNVRVEIQYCKSEHNYMIQASDIIANRILTSYITNKPELRTKIPNHFSLTFP